jgi:non-ribosomal peptide synthase protein (TIGR01720 family)
MYRLPSPNLRDQYQRSLDIEKGEIAKFVLVQTPQTEANNRLLIVIHHLSVDGVSWRILLEDIELLLTAITNGDKATLGSKSSSYRQWYNTLETYGKSQRSENQLEYWNEVAKSYHPLPVDTVYDDTVSVKESANYSHRLPAASTRHLIQEVPRVYHTEINDILLGSLAKTISDWSNNDKVTIGLEGHGREDIAEGIDTSRTVGWFTNLYPVLLTVKPGNQEDDIIKTVKEQLRQVPDRGIGYGVLKYINKEETLQGKEPWDIVFNYLGQTDNIVNDGKWFKGAGEAAGATRSEQHILSEKISINCIIRGGQLSVNWTYSSRHYNEATIQKLAEEYITNLESTNSPLPPPTTGRREYLYTHQITDWEQR